MHTMFDYGQSIFSRQLLCRLPSGEVCYPSQHGIIILTRLIFTSLPQNNNLYYIFEIDFVGLYQCLHNKHGWGANVRLSWTLVPFFRQWAIKVDLCQMQKFPWKRGLIYFCLPFQNDTVQCLYVSKSWPQTQLFSSRLNDLFISVTINPYPNITEDSWKKSFLSRVNLYWSQLLKMLS